MQGISYVHRDKPKGGRCPLKINEVEQLVGVTTRNIRFYEKEGLLTPGRDSGNGYRDYSEADVETLKQIKLFRKLDLPLEEIRRIQNGTLAVADAMGRHVIQLERKRTNLAAMVQLCQKLEADRPQLAAMETDRYLEHMEKQEQEGTVFVNIRKKDARSKYVGPIAAAVVMIAMMAGLIALLVWAFVVDPAEAPPLGMFLFVAALPVVTIVGVLLALRQRITEIQGGEEDAASKY